MESKSTQMLVPGSNPYNIHQITLHTKEGTIGCKTSNFRHCCSIYSELSFPSGGWVRGWGGVGGLGCHIVLRAVKALIISALLVLVAWLRWKANTGNPRLLSRALSIEEGSHPGLYTGGPFSWKRLGHCGVSGALTIWRHIYKAFTFFTKAQTELRPKTPLFTCFFVVVV